ncbi:hypothetical protein CUMW_131170 [Citrus unshiu]|uniref:Uncharacterized protein n=1 Tax=Citrus unshiu TaxID=55188 RepID=A0A2H5PFC1_CITUN|nr:hypothetical protein CUMW_131170 [Citrus unshiu]
MDNSACQLLNNLLETQDSQEKAIRPYSVTEKRNDTLAIDAALKDQHRISFILKHLYRIRRAIDGRRDLILDSRHGLYYTDYKNNLTRIPKDSAKWFHAFIKGQGQASGFTLLHHIIKLC